MTLDELKAEAAKITAIQPAGDYKHHTFTARSGGIGNRYGVPEVHRGTSDHYSTVRHGATCRTTVTVECQDTGTRDADGRVIYATPAGMVFVYYHIPGSPESFAVARFVAPNLATAG